MRVPVLLATALLLSFWAHAAAAHSYSQSKIKIGHVWALPTAGTEGEVFMPLYNGGGRADRLVGVQTARAESVVFHDARGEETSAFTLPPGRPLAMRPGKRALVLKNLTAPLQTGDRFEMSLTFERAGDVNVTVWVEDAPSD